jgi:5-methylcytosine-specific restriction endonuclease McrA
MDDSTTKTCPRCKTPKPLSDFRNDKSRADGLFSWCRDCCHANDRSETRKAQKRERQNERYATEPEYRDRVKQRMTRHYETSEEYRARQIERQAEYQSIPTNKIRRDMLARARQASGRYRQKDRDRNKDPRRRVLRKVYAQTRRARKLNTNTSFTEAEWLALCAKYHHCCLRCGQQKPLTPDHIRPLSRGGSNDITNIQPLCWHCNTCKGTKTTDYRKLYQSSLDLGDV